MVPDKLDNPAPDWISERTWMDILTLPALSNFTPFAKEFAQLMDGFKRMFDSTEPHMYAINRSTTHYIQTYT